MVLLLLDGIEDPVSLPLLLDGLDITETHLLNQRNQVSWDDFVVIMERLTAGMGGPEGIRAFGRTLHATPRFKAFWLMGRTLLSSADLYYVGARFFGPRMFQMIRAEIFEPSPDRIVQHLTISEGHQDCPALFHLMHGGLEAAPMTFGFGPSRVEAVIEPRQVTYQIFPQNTRPSLTGRAVRALSAPFTLPRMVRELIEQQEVIIQNYTEIRSARDRIESQALDLERVNSIGAQLSHEIFLDRVTDVLVRVMLEELGAAGVELWLLPSEIDSASEKRDGSSKGGSPGESQASSQGNATGMTPDGVGVSAPSRNLLSPSWEARSLLPADSAEGEENGASNAARFYRRGGQQRGAPTSVHLLETASRPVGTLKVWRRAGDPQQNASDMLGRLLPWISMSLDNARSYEALDRHASKLEQRVRERTARLLSANHHLVKEVEERKKATTALLKSEAQRLEAERLASIGTLAAGIAHEINNPVGAILAAAQFALLTHRERDGFSDDEMTGALNDIVLQAKRCGGIVRSVLQFSRDERTEKWRCNIPESVQRGARLADRLATERRAEIDMVLPDDEVWGEANPIQIEQAIVNLVRNAIEADASEIRIEATLLDSENAIQVEVSDDGPGMTARERERVFEPFYTTKQEDGGTGLGLSVVHGIVEEHGGELTIDPRPGGGTRVRLKLPLYETPTGQAAPATTRDVSGPGTSTEAPTESRPAPLSAGRSRPTIPGRPSRLV